MFDVLWSCSSLTRFLSVALYLLNLLSGDVGWWPDVIWRILLHMLCFLWYYLFNGSFISDCSRDCVVSVTDIHCHALRVTEASGCLLSPNGCHCSQLSWFLHALHIDSGCGCKLTPSRRQLWISSCYHAATASSTVWYSLKQRICKDGWPDELFKWCWCCLRLIYTVGCFYSHDSESY